jgi:rod shape-determining protein MreB
MSSIFDSFKPIIYIQISPERLSVRNVKSGEEISEVPEVALSAPPKIKILGVGSQARISQLGGVGQVVNPFSHPRSMVSDFTVAEQLIKEFLRRLQGKSILTISPLVVMHPLGDPLGGFTQVEYRAFREMALGAGASEVIMWHGPRLTDQQILSRQFPAEGEVRE